MRKKENVKKSVFIFLDLLFFAKNKSRFLFELKNTQAYLLTKQAMIAIAKTMKCKAFTKLFFSGVIFKMQKLFLVVGRHGLTDRASTSYPHGTNGPRIESPWGQHYICLPKLQFMWKPNLLYCDDSLEEYRPIRCVGINLLPLQGFTSISYHLSNYLY